MVVCVSCWGFFLSSWLLFSWGIAIYAQSRHGMGDAVEWPNWTGWVMVLCGIGVLWHGWDLRRSGRQKMTMIADKWAALEGQRGQVERVFSSLVSAGHYEAGLSARYERAQAERARVGARIAEHQRRVSSHRLARRQEAMVMRFLRALIAWRTRMPQSWLRATSSRVRPAGAMCGATRSARSSKTWTFSMTSQTASKQSVRTRTS